MKKCIIKMGISEFMAASNDLPGKRPCLFHGGGNGKGTCYKEHVLFGEHKRILVLMVILTALVHEALWDGETYSHNF